MKFIEEDSAYLLRRIPAQVKVEHYHSDEVHIRDLLEESGLTPRGGIALAAATIRGLILTVSHQEQIGALSGSAATPSAFGAAPSSAGRIRLSGRGGSAMPFSIICSSVA